MRRLRLYPPLGAVAGSTGEGGAALGTRSDYEPCDCRHKGKRLAWALSRVFVTRTNSGKSVPNAALLGSFYLGNMAAASWYPSSYTARGEAVRAAHTQVAFVALFHLLHEFTPDIKRRLRRRKN